MPPVYDDAQVERIATRAAHKAVSEFVASPEYAATIARALEPAICTKLETLGIDTKNPAATRRDMVSLRDWNNFWSTVREAGIASTVKWLVGGALAALVVGIGIALHR